MSAFETSLRESNTAAKRLRESACALLEQWDVPDEVLHSVHTPMRSGRATSRSRAHTEPLDMESVKPALQAHEIESDRLLMRHKQEVAELAAVGMITANNSVDEATSPSIKSPSSPTGSSISARDDEGGGWGSDKDCHKWTPQKWTLRCCCGL